LYCILICYLFILKTWKKKAFCYYIYIDYIFAFVRHFLIKIMNVILKVINDNIYEYMWLGNIRCSLIPVPRLILQDIFFIEKNNRGYWYVCKIYFARHRVKKKRIVSGSCLFVMPRCVRRADRPALSDASATSRRRSYRAPHHVSCEPDMSLVRENYRLWIDTLNGRTRKKRQLISSSVATSINLICTALLLLLVHSVRIDNKLILSDRFWNKQ